MTLAPGQTLSQYRILDKLGEGGMGVVWEAVDTRLDRSAAIKVLPETVADDPERLARFQREAKLLASLSHPGIAAVYGLDDAAGIHFIAMEKVPGDTLEDRLAAGPLPLGDTIDIARQIADALSFAHRNGVLHRDLKPANVKITPEGKVKVLDFGLAKVFEAAATVSGSSEASTPTLSPTMTSANTLGGMILGTAAYMSPEQARARPLDNRTDIFSFGCVLYELLSGHRPFQADTVPDTLARVLQSEPDWDVLPATTPPVLRRLLERCLQKDADRRLHDVADARFDLEAALEPTPEPATTGAPARETASPLTARRMLLLVGIGIALGCVIGGLFVRQRQNPTPARTPLHLTISTPASERIQTDRFAGLALVPDGSAIVYVGKAADGDRQLFARSLADPVARPIEGSRGADSVFISPDGDWVGFVVNGGLGKVPIGGGSPVALAPQGEAQQGAMWSTDGYVYYVENYLQGFDRVSATGGSPEVLTTKDDTADEFGQWQPLPVPGGRYVLYSRWKSRVNDCSLRVLDLETRETAHLLDNACSPRLTPNGYLVFARGNSIAAVAFDPKTATIRGEPRLVLDDVYVAPGTGTLALDIARNGTLAYLASSDAGSHSALVSVDLQGRVEPLDLELRDHKMLALSPNGRFVALQIRNGVENDLWIYDFERDAMRRFTFDGSNESMCWTRDGRRVSFASLRRGPYDVFWKPVDESEAESTLLAGDYDIVPKSWSSDGRLVATHLPAGGAEDLWIHDFGDGANGEGEPLVVTPGEESDAAFSPDDRWIAYASSVSGRFEVYVRPTPPGAGHWQVSIDGGTDPTWSPDGTTLYYVSAGALYSVALETRTAFSAGRPERLFGAEQLGGTIWDYAPHPDGKRFIVLRSEQTRDATIQVVLNWTATLR